MRQALDVTLKTDLVLPPAIQESPLMALATAPMGRKYWGSKKVQISMLQGRQHREASIRQLAWAHQVQARCGERRGEHQSCSPSPQR